MPWSSPRSSGWRATDWIIEPKMLPMPTPPPSAPRPTPRARPIAFPALVTSPDARGPADAFEVGEDERQQRERQRDGEGRGRSVGPPDRDAVPGLSGQR